MSAALRPPVRLWLLVAALCAAPGPAIAQDTPAAATTPAEAEPPPTPSPGIWTIEEIPVAASDTETRLREHRTVLEPSSDVETVAQQLGELKAALELLQDSAEAKRPQDYSMRALQDLRQQWETKKGLLETWGKTLEARLGQLRDVRLELDGLEERWRRTIESERDKELPESLTERLAQLRTGVTEVQSLLTTRLDTVLTMQNEVSAADVAAAEILERIGAAEELSRRGMFTLDSPPVWSTWGDVADVPTVAENVGTSWRRIRDGVDEFLAQYRDRFEQHLLLLAFLALGVHLLHRHGRSLELEDADRRRSIALLSRPVATAWLLGVMFMNFFYPNAPIVIYQLGNLLVLPAVARLALLVTPRRAQITLLGLLSLVLLAGLEDLVVGHVALRRNILLVISIVGLAGLWRASRPGHEILRPESRRWERAVRVGMSLSQATLAASIVSNAVGAVVLAQMLCWATLQAGYNALLAVLALRVIDALLAIGLRTPLWQTLNLVRHHTSEVRATIMKVLTLATIGLWLWEVLKDFRLQATVVTAVTEWLEASWDVGALHISLGGILAFLVTIYLSILISRLVRFVLEEDVLPRADLPRGVPATISMMAHYSIIALGLIAALSVAGVQTDKFVILFSAFGVGIGFGLQNVVNNFVSGLILIFERPIQVGDTVEVGPVLGSVKRIGIRASIVRTFEGAEVIVPNGDLISQQVTNWTLSDRQRRITIAVLVERGADPEQVRSILLAAARAHPDIIEEPAPAAHFHGFLDGALDFKLWCWTADSSKWVAARTDIGLAIDRAMRDAGITLSHPPRDVYLKSADPTTAPPLEPPPAED